MQEPQSPQSEGGAPTTLAEADYNRLFNLSPDLLCVAGLDGYFKRVNPSWMRVLGWSEAELLARPVEFFMHPEDRATTLHARAELSKGTPSADSRIDTFARMDRSAGCRGNPSPNLAPAPFSPWRATSPSAGSWIRNTWC